MASHGSITINPWSGKYLSANPHEKWEKVWPEIDNSNVDPLQSAADYYLLFGIVNNAFLNFEPLRLPNADEVVNAAIKLGLTMNDMIHRIKRVSNILDRDPRKELTEISDAANNLLVELVERLDPVFRGYVYMACGGELRHHRAIGDMALPVNRSSAWCSYRKIVEEYGFEDVLNTTAKYFRDFNSSSYGSEKWAQAAELLLEREKGELGPTEYLNKMLFVDRVFTLEHNGGCFLNKIEWANKRSNRASPFDYGINNMKSVVLDAHCSNPPNVYALYNCASDEVRNLINAYFKVASQNTMQISVDVSHITNSTSTSTSTTVKMSDYFSASKYVVSKYGEVLDMAEIPYSGQVKIPDSYLSVSASFKINVNHNGETKMVDKGYHLENISALSDKTFYWKHMVKSIYPGSTAESMIATITWGSYRIKINLNHVPSSLYGYDIARMFVNIKNYCEE